MPRPKSDPATPAAPRDFERYRSASKQRLLKTLKVLAGREVHGLSPSQIARAVGTGESNTTSDLAQLYLAELAEPFELDGVTRWRLAPFLIQAGLAMLDGADRAQARLDDLRSRYTRTR